MKISKYIYLLLCLVLLLGVYGCNTGKTQTSASNPGQNQGNPDGGTGSKGKNQDSPATISLKNNSIELFVGETKKAEVSVSPEDTEVQWKSIAPDMADVSMDGMITGKSEGETKVEAVIKSDSSKKAVCTVVVKKKSTSMKGIVFDKAKAEDSQSIHGINGAGELTMNLSPSPDKPGEYKGNFHMVRTFDYGGGHVYEEMTISGKMEATYDTPDISMIVGNASKIREESGTLTNKDGGSSTMIVEPLIAVDDKTLEARGYISCSSNMVDDRVVTCDGSSKVFKSNSTQQMSIPFILSIQGSKAKLYIYPHHLSSLIFEGTAVTD